MTKTIIIRLNKHIQVKNLFFLRRIIMDHYGCKTCGKVTIGKESLCDPEPIDKVYQCSECKESYSKPDHLVNPIPVEFKYYCSDCGRGALTDKEVCTPAPV